MDANRLPVRSPIPTPSEHDARARGADQGLANAASTPTIQPLAAPALRFATPSATATERSATPMSGWVVHEVTFSPRAAPPQPKSVVALPPLAQLLAQPLAQTTLPSSPPSRDLSPPHAVLSSRPHKGAVQTPSDARLRPRPPPPPPPPPPKPSPQLRERSLSHDDESGASMSELLSAWISGAPPPAAPPAAPASGVLACGLEDGSISLTRLLPRGAGGAAPPRARVIAHGGATRCLSAFTDGSFRLLSGGDDRTLAVWDARNGELLARLEGHLGAVIACAALPDGRCASGGEDHSVCVWLLRPSAAVQRTMEGHEAPVCALAALPRAGGKSDPGQVRLASACLAGAVRLWEADSGRCERILAHPAGQVHLAAIPALAAAAHALLASAGSDGVLRLWRLDGSAAAAVSARAASLAPLRGFLAVGGADGEVAVFDVQALASQTPRGENGEGACVARLRPPARQPVSALAELPRRCGRRALAYASAWAEGGGVGGWQLGGAAGAAYETALSEGTAEELLSLKNVGGGGARLVCIAAVGAAAAAAESGPFALARLCGGGGRLC